MSTDYVWESQKETQVKACIQILWMGKCVLFFSLPFFFWMHQSAQEEMSQSNSFHLLTNKQQYKSLHSPAVPTACYSITCKHTLC